VRRGKAYVEAALAHAGLSAGEAAALTAERQARTVAGFDAAGRLAIVQVDGGGGGDSEPGGATLHDLAGLAQALGLVAAVALARGDAAALFHHGALVSHPTSTAGPAKSGARRERRRKLRREGGGGGGLARSTMWDESPSPPPSWAPLGLSTAWAPLAWQREAPTAGAILCVHVAPPPVLVFDDRAVDAAGWPWSALTPPTAAPARQGVPTRGPSVAPTRGPTPGPTHVPTQPDPVVVGWDDDYWAPRPEADDDVNAEAAIANLDNRTLTALTENLEFYQVVFPFFSFYVFPSCFMSTYDRCRGDARLVGGKRCRATAVGPRL
jgi:hypothetical protein